MKLLITAMICGFVVMIRHAKPQDQVNVGDVVLCSAIIVVVEAFVMGMVK